MGDELKSIARFGAVVLFCVDSSSLSLPPWGAGGELEATTLRLGLFAGGAIEADDIYQLGSFVGLASRVNIFVVVVQCLFGLVVRLSRRIVELGRVDPNSVSLAGFTPVIL
jgi:hypothetical protein